MKATLVFFFSIFFSLSMHAQTVADYMFVVPDVFLPQIETNRLRDMIDLKKAGQQGKAPNLLGGQSEVTALTDDYLKIEVSPSMQFELKRLIVADKEDSDTLLCVVRTTCAPLCDSDISFFSKDWVNIDREVRFQKPQVMQFLKPGNMATDSLVLQAIETIDLPLIKLSFIDDQPLMIRAEQHWEDILPDALKKGVMDYFEESIEIPLVKE